MEEDDEEAPVVGEMYRGFMVTDVKEESSGRKSGQYLRMKRFITVDNGMTLVEEVFRDTRKIEGSYHERPYEEVEAPKGVDLPKEEKKKKKKKDPPKSPKKTDDGEAKRKKEEEEKERLKREEEEKAKKEEEEKALLEAQEKARLEEERLEEERRAKEAEEKAQEEERARKAEEARRNAEEEEKARKEEEERKRKEADAERLRASQEAMAKRKKAADERRAAEQKARELARKRAAIVDSWNPLIVKARSPESKIGKSEPRTDALQGVWTYPDGKKPADDFNCWKPQDVVVHPPGKDVPRSVDPETPKGFWGYAPGTEPEADGEDWLPRSSGHSPGGKKPDIILFPPGVKPKDGDKDLKVQGEWTYPSKDASFPPLPKPKEDWKPQAATIYPKSQTPDNAVGDGGQPQGVWSFNAGEMDDDDWKPMDVMIYPEGQEPGSIDDTKPHGVWGIAPGAKPDEDGNYSPEGLWFCSPGESPDDDAWEPQGVWTTHPGSPEQCFPPLKEPKDAWKPQPAIVYPKSQVPEKKIGEDGQPQGVWSHKGAPTDDEGWEPMQVMIYPEGQTQAAVDESKPHGVWGLAPNATPDEDGNYSPDGLWFCGPGEDPPEEEGWRPQGVWGVDPNSKDQSYPPVKQTQAITKPQAATVYPKSQAPDGEDGTQGVWSFNSGDTDDDDWNPMEVMMYPTGQEPDNIDDSTPHGVWGVVPGATPDEDGNYSADALWFCAPGESPEDDDWEPQGVWIAESEDQSWPPMKEPKDTWQPQPATVYPKSQVPDKKLGEEGQPQGVWSYNGTPMDDDDWNPMQVIVYPEGKAPSSVDESKPHGVWGLAPGATPDEDGNYAPEGLWFCGPGEDLPEDESWRPQGTWVVDPKTDQSFPPVKDSGGILSKPQAATVYPKSQTPAAGSQDKPQGVWSFGAADMDDEDWIPMDVMTYPEGQEPKNLDESKPQGVWGLAPGAKPDEDGNYPPDALWFCAPGESPADDDWSPQGMWTVHPGSEDQSFPPLKEYKEPPAPADSSTPRKLTVYPEKKAPNSIEKGSPKGIWRYTPGKKVQDAGKKPKEILLHSKGNEPADYKPSNGGLWGYAPGATPNADGEYLPKDTWIFAPGEKPPDDWEPRGVWTNVESPKPRVSVRMTKVPSPEKAKEAPKPKAKRPDRKFSKSAWVYPSKASAPEKGEKNNPEGVWTTCPGGASEDTPQELLLHKLGKEPSDLEKVPHGVYGYAAGSKPDENGNWRPCDMLFFPPGEEAPPDLQERGTWTYPSDTQTETIMTYKWVGNDMVYEKRTEVRYMGTTSVFVTEFTR